MSDVITKFKLETTQYDSKLRDATDRMKELMRSVQVAGGSLNDLSAKDKELARSFGTLSTGANNAKDKVRELANDLNRVGRAYFTMTKEMQQSDVGKAIAEQMRVMKDRLTEAKKELYDMGGAEQAAAAGGLDLDAVMESLASQFGISTKLLSSLTSGTVATTAAVTAGAAAVAMATKAWVDYNDEISRQNNVTTVTTRLKGDDAEALTMGVRALSRTYDVDFRDAVNAANTLIQQFGVTGVEALRLLQDGMQGMIAGDGGKLLSMIQQYAPSFRDAGIEASQLVAIIQNSEGGIFTDQNMSAITMGIKNIRLMTKQTSEALAQLGIDGEEMTRKLNEGSMTIFEAMQQVSEAIENAGGSSQAVGQVMQTVFGRQGTAAGTNLGKAIAQLNTNLQETKKQTGELGESFVRLNEANLELEQTMQEIFGMSGWEDMNNFLKTELANTLTFTLEFLINIRDTLKSVGSYATDMWNDIVGRFTGEAYKPKEKAQINAQNQNPAVQWQWGKQSFGGYTTQQAQPPQTTQQQPQNSYQFVTSGGKVVRESRIVNGERIDMPVSTNQRTYQQVKADLDRAKKELENAKDSISKGTAKSLVDYYEQELKRLPKQDVKPITNTKATTSTTTTKKDVWAPIDMKSVDISKLGILPPDTEKQLDAVIAKVKELNGVTIDPRTMEVTVDDVDALTTLKNIDGVKIEPKTFSITATDEALPLLKDIEGVSIDDKTFSITATDEALPLLREIEGVTIDPKTFSITATDEALPLLREIDGVTIDPKTFSITATDEALPLLREIEGVKLADKELKVKVTVDDSELTKALKEIKKAKDAFLFGRSLSDVQKDLQQAQREYNNAGDAASRAEANKKVKKYQTELEGIKNEGDPRKGGFADAYNYDFSKDIKKLDVKMKNGDELAKQGENVAESWQQAASAIGSVGNALQGLKDPSGQVAGTVAQAIAQIALGFAQATTAGASAGPWAWIASVASGLGTMMSTISAIHNATGYAEGGLVKGPKGVDNVPAWLTDGEIVLNAAQQNNVAAKLTSSEGMGGGASSTPSYVKGEDIFLGVNNYLRRKGRGELVTSR